MNKKVDYKAGEPDFEDEFGFNFDQFDQPPPPPPKGREAVTASAKAALKGVKQGVTDPQNVERLIRDTLPAGYGQAYDFYDQSVNSLRDSYEKVLDEIRPIKSQVKDLVGKYVPDVEDFLPQSVVNKLKDFAKREDSGWDSAREEGDPVQQTLNEIFKQQAQNEQSNIEREDKQRELDRGFEELRHRSTGRLLHGIWENTTKLAEYQDNILIDYQRKSLELAMLQYGVIGDQLALQKQLYNAMIEKFDAVIQNTALPDYKKTPLSEATGDSLRNKFITDARDSFFGDSTNFISEFFGRVGEKSRAAISSAASGVKQGIQLAGMDIDDLENGNEDNLTKNVRKVSKFATEYALDKAAGYLNRKVGRNKTVNGIGSELAYNVKNVGETVRNWLLDPKDESIVDNMRHMVAEFGDAKSIGRPKNEAADVDSLSAMQKATQWNMQDSKSIREIIPGYLSMILRELQMTRTGKPAELIKYDFDDNKFVGQEQLTKSIINRAMSGNRQNVDESLEKIFKKVDLGNRLDNNLRQKAKMSLFKHMQKDGSTSIEKLLDNKAWEGLSDTEAKRVMEVFNRYIRTDSRGKRYMGAQNVRRQDELTDSLKSIGRNFKNPMGYLQNVLSSGGHDLVGDTGFIGTDKKLNNERVYELLNMSDDDYFKATGFRPVAKKKEEKKLDRLQKMMDSATKATKDLKSNVVGKMDAVDESDPGRWFGAGKYIDKLKTAKNDVKSFLSDTAKSARDSKHVQSIIRQANNAIDKAKSIDEVSAVLEAANKKVEEAKEFKKSLSLQSTADIAAKYGNINYGAVDEIDLGKLAEEMGIAPATIIPGAPAVEPINQGEQIRKVIQQPRGPDDDLLRNQRAMQQMLQGQRQQGQGDGMGGPTPAIYPGLNGGQQQQQPQYMQQQSSGPFKELADKISGSIDSLKSHIGEGLARDKTLLDVVDADVASKNHLENILQVLNKINENVQEGIKVQITHFKKRSSEPAPVTLMEGIKSGIGGLKSKTEGIIEQGNGAGSDLLSRFKNKVNDISTNEKGEKQYSSLFKHIYEKGRDKLGDTKDSIRDFISRHKESVTSKLGYVLRGKDKAVDFADKKISRTIKGLFGVLGDVYVEGEKRPRMTSEKIKAGRYFNKNDGKVIRSLTDIDGDVVDKDGNIILEADEIENAYIGGLIRRSLAELIQSAGRKIRGFSDLVQAVVPQALASAIDKASRIANFIKSKLPPFDVYVRDELQKPVLYAELMKIGHYFSRESKKLISHPRDIDGEVMDKDGNIVVSIEQLKTGLVDINNVSIRNPAARFITKTIGSVVNTGLKAFGFLKNVGGGLFDFAGSLLGGFKEYFRDIFTPFTEVISNSKESLEVQKKIYELLDMRMPGKRRKVFGDMDGDGIRDGSAEDEQRKRKKASEEKKAKDGENGKDGKPGWLAGVGSIIGNLFDKKSKKSDDEEDEEEDRSLLEQAADAADIYDALNGDGGGGDDVERKRKRKRRLKRSGKLGKQTEKQIADQARNSARKKVAGQAAKSAATEGAKAVGKQTLAQKGAGMLGRGALGAGRLGLATAGGLWSAGMALAPSFTTMGKAASLAGRGSLMAGRLGLAGLGALGTVGGAAGALLSWPVTLGSMAAYGGYLWYKSSQKTKLDDMSRVRIAQYGFDDTNEELVGKAFAIEDAFAPHVKIGDDGKITLNHDDVDKEELLEKLEISTPAGLELFEKWYHGRFRPVLAANLTALKAVTAGKTSVELSKIMSLPPEDKVKFLDKATSGLESAHNLMSSPTADMHVSQNDMAVKNAVDAAKLKIDKELKNSGKKTLSEDAVLTGKNTAAVAALLDGPKSKEEMLERYRKNQELYRVVDKDGKDIQGTTVDKEKAIAEGTAKVIASAVIPEDLVYRGGNRVDALTAIRYKAYGLQTMEAGKIKQLIVLEKLCNKFLQFKAGKATLSGSTVDIMKVAASEFGIGDTNGRLGRAWKEWFNHRFLTVYLAYVNTMCTIAKSENPENARMIITPVDQTTIANQIIGATGATPVNTNTSIWKMPASPWEDYELTSNPDICKGNLEAIRALAKRVILGEDVVPPSERRDKMGDRVKTMNEEAGVKSDSLLSGKNVLKSESGKLTRDSGINAAGDVVSTGRPVTAGGQKMTIGSGTAGKFDAIPNPTGKGWNNVKDAIMHAGKVTGVDPRLIAMIAGMESSFDPNSVNPTTQAAGLGNFMPKTWTGMKKYFKKYGIPENTSPFDARANAIMIGELIKENARMIKKASGRDMTQTDAYMAHFLGGPAAAKFFKYDSTDIGAERFPTEAKSNTYNFYKNPKTLSGPLTLGDIYKNFDTKMKKVVSSFGIDEKDFEGHTSAESMDAANTTTATTTGAITRNADGSRTIGSTTVGQDGVARRASAPEGGTSSPAPAGGYGGSTSMRAPVINLSNGRSDTSGGGHVVDASGGSANTGLMNNVNTAKNQVQINPGLRGPTSKNVISVTIKREESTVNGTFGVMTLHDGTTLHTLELPWKDNQQAKSCIPPGNYMAKRRKTTKFGMAYEVMGVPGRSAILIHAGTFAGDKSAGKGIKANSQGCILLGVGRVTNNGQPRLDGTRAAMDLFDEKTGNAVMRLNILPSPGQMNASTQIAAMEHKDDVKGPTGSVPGAANALDRPGAKRSSVDSGVPSNTTPIANAIRTNISGASAAQPTVSTSDSTVPLQTVVRKKAETPNLSRGINQTPQEIEKNRKDNAMVIVEDGFKEANAALKALVQGQINTNNLLTQIRDKTAEESKSAAKSQPENSSKPLPPPPPLPTPGSAKANPPRQSVPLSRNPVGMDRLT